MQLEGRARTDQMLNRRPALLLARVVEHQVALAEGPALGVLAGETHRDPAGDQTRQRELLGLRPVDLAFGERRPPPVHLPRQLRVDGKAVRYGEQLPVQGFERVRGHHGLDVGLGRGVHRRAADLWSVGRARFHVLVRARQPSLRGITPRPRVVGAQQSLLDQLGGENLAHGRMLMDGLVHLRLGVSGLVRFVVAESPIADQVDDDVAAELLSEGGRQPNRADARRDVVGVDMDDRQIEAFSDI